MADFYHKPYCLQFHADANVAAVNVKCSSRQWSNRPTIDNEVTSGSESPDFISFMARKVLGELESYYISTLLDILGAKGFCIKSDVNPGVAWFEQKYEKCGTPVAGSVHRSLLTSFGRVVPDSITVDHQGNAVLALRIIPILKNPDDPTNPPILLKSDTVALPSITLPAERFTIGPLQIAGTKLNDYTTYRIDFGNDVNGRSTESDIDDTFVDHSTHAPRLEVEGIDPTWFDSVGITGKSLAHADTYAYLRKRTEDETNFVPGATTEHIGFTFAGLGTVDDIAAGGEILRPTATSLIVTGAVDAAGNEPMIINTGVALPA